MSYFNRKERKLKISKKLGTNRITKITPNWRQKHAEEKRLKEDELKKSLSLIKNGETAGPPFEIVKNNQGTRLAQDTGTNKSSTWYSLSIALPGSILNNVLKETLTTYVCGEIARSCAIFCVEEVIVYDETASMSQTLLDDYNEGRWSGDWNTELYVESNFYLAKILEYMECPQYLRKALHPHHPALKFAGLLNPLNGMHHLKAYELDIPYREGVTLKEPTKEGWGSRCDVGLNTSLQLQAGEVLPPNTRVSVKITSGLNDNGKRLRGVLTSPKMIKQESGIYWGYNVRVVSRISDVFAKKYDYVIGTSEKGQPIKKISLDFKENCSILLVFGGLSGLEAALASDDGVFEKDPSKYFKHYLNALPDQGSRVIRTEEAIPITLSMMKYKLGEIGRCMNKMCIK